MRILYISSEYPPETGFGGIGTYTKYMAEGMASRGHEVTVFAQSLSGKEELSVLNRVRVYRIPGGRFPLPGAKLLYPFRKFCYSTAHHLLIRLAWAKSVRDACNRLEAAESDFDIIEYPECGGEGFLLQKKCTTALFARLHTPWHLIRRIDEIREPVGDHLLLPWIENRSVHNADMVTSPSQALAKLISKEWNVKQITVIPNPIPADAFCKKRGGGWIYTGRVEKRKGVHILLKSYAALCKKHSPPPLVLLGKSYGSMPDGRSYGEYVRSLLQQLHLTKRVQWIEGVPLDSVRDYLQRSSVAFFPSLWENFPYTCLEAMACGLTVAVSDCGGFPELIEHKESGIVFKSESCASLTEAMEQILEKPRMINRLGVNARERIRTIFHTATVCSSMESMYQRTLERKRHAAGIAAD